MAVLKFNGTARCVTNFQTTSVILEFNSTGLKGNVKSSGLTYAMPFPVILWCGIKDVLLSFSAKDIIPVCLGNILTLFLATNGIKICCMCHDLGRIFQGTRFFLYINQTELLISWFMESGFRCDKL